MEDEKIYVDQLYQELEKFRGLCNKHLERISSILQNIDTYEDSDLHDIRLDILLFWIPHIKQSLEGPNTVKNLQSILHVLDQWRLKHDN